MLFEPGGRIVPCTGPLGRMAMVSVTDKFLGVVDAGRQMPNHPL
jgi:hypothetical protein